MRRESLCAFLLTTRPGDRVCLYFVASDFCWHNWTPNTIHLITKKKKKKSKKGSLLSPFDSFDDHLNDVSIGFVRASQQRKHQGSQLVCQRHPQDYVPERTGDSICAVWTHHHVSHPLRQHHWYHKLYTVDWFIETHFLFYFYTHVSSRSVKRGGFHSVWHARGSGTRHREAERHGAARSHWAHHCQVCQQPE